jgi:hypothetical protein
MVPISARNTLLGGAILLNRLENERTVSQRKKEGRIKKSVGNL